MQRIVLVLVLLITMLAPVMTAQAQTPPATVLLRSYGANASNGIDAYRPRQFKAGLLMRDVQRDNGTYPNSTWKLTDPGPYNGWDVFAFGGTGGSFTSEVSNTWATFEATRPVVVGYVHRNNGAAPSWITAANSGWYANGTVDAKIQDARNWTDPRPVYVKAFPAGTVTIPSPSQDGQPKILPWLLFAEDGGTQSAMGITAKSAPDKAKADKPKHEKRDHKGIKKGKHHKNTHGKKKHNRAGFGLSMAAFAGTPVGVPSVPPPVPAGKTEPVPNTKCPDWVHDAIKAPNSNYPTWHGPINTTYWCYYTHEHGSDPALVFGNDVGRYPRFGEIAAQMVPTMTENHWGHKVYAIDYPDVDMLVVHHFGTTGLGRVDTCKQQRHLVEVSIRNNAHTQTLMIVRFMADYGRSLGARIQDQTDGPIDPSICPNGNAATGYTGVVPSRQVPIVPFGYNPNAPTANAYEPWVFPENAYATTLGIGGNFVFNTVDPLTVPSDITGNTAVEVMTRSGTGRFFTPNTMQFHCPAAADPTTGYWWTDAMAMNVVPSNTPGAVRQYCKPGWSGFAPMPAGSPDSGHRGGKNMTRWGDWAVTVPTGEPGDFEGSIANAHGPN